MRPEYRGSGTPERTGPLFVPELVARRLWKALNPDVCSASTLGHTEWADAHSLRMPGISRPGGL